MRWLLQLGWLQGILGLKSMLIDRGMLITDFFLATLIPFVIQYLIWTNVFESSNRVEIQSFTQIQLCFYFAYVLTIGRLSNGYDVIRYFAEDVREGNFELRLIRPMPFPWQRLWVFLGESSIYLVAVLCVMGIHLGFLLRNEAGFVLSSKPLWCVAGLFLLLLSQCLCFALSFLFACCAFWTVRSDMMLQLSIILPGSLGGILIPPSFWPSFLKPIMHWNPYRFIIAGPAEFLVSPSWRVFNEIFVGSLVYILVIGMIARWAWYRGIRRAEGIGG